MRWDIARRARLGLRDFQARNLALLVLPLAAQGVRCFPPHFHAPAFTPLNTMQADRLGNTRLLLRGQRAA